MTRVCCVVDVPIRRFTISRIRGGLTSAGLTCGPSKRSGRRPNYHVASAVLNVARSNKEEKRSRYRPANSSSSNHFRWTSMFHGKHENGSLPVGAHDGPTPNGRALSTTSSQTTDDSKPGRVGSSSTQRDRLTGITCHPKPGCRWSSRRGSAPNGRPIHTMFHVKQPAD